MLLDILFQFFISIGALAVGCYVLIIRPQRNRQQLKNLIATLSTPGALVQTAHGLIGTITLITHNTIIMELATGQKVEVLKQTITKVAHGNAK